MNIEYTRKVNETHPTPPINVLTSIQSKVCKHLLITLNNMYIAKSYHKIIENLERIIRPIK